MSTCGRLIFIDTEIMSFISGLSTPINTANKCPVYSKPEYVTKLLKYLSETMTSEATLWLSQRIEFLVNAGKDQYEQGIPDKIIPHITEFDDSKINFEKVQVQFTKEKIEKIKQEEEKKETKEQEINDDSLKALVIWGCFS